jgi:hypothetical protein
MAKRSFLVPLAVALAAASQTSTAAVKNDNVADAPTETEQSSASKPTAMRFSIPEKGQSVNAIISSGEDLHKFVLHRAADGQIVAAHESHYSHSSHSSHSSHYSSR